MSTLRVRAEMHMLLTPTKVQCPGRAVVFWRGGTMCSVWGICMFKGWEYLSVCVHRCLRRVHVY